MPRTNYILALAFGFYHFSCIMLLLYKPGPKFAFRILGRELSDIEVSDPKQSGSA